MVLNKRKLSIDGDITKYIDNDNFPHQITIYLKEKQITCSGLVLSHHSSVLETKIREENGEIMFDELIEEDNNDDQLMFCVRMLHGYDPKVNDENLDISFITTLLKFSSWYEIDTLFDMALDLLDEKLPATVESDDEFKDYFSVFKICTLLKNQSHCQKLKQLLLDRLSAEHLTRHLEINADQEHHNVLNGTDISALIADSETNSGKLLIAWVNPSSQNQQFVLKNPGLFSFNSLFPSGNDFDDLVSMISNNDLSTNEVKDLLDIQKKYFSSAMAMLQNNIAVPGPSSAAVATVDDVPPESEGPPEGSKEHKKEADRKKATFKKKTVKVQFVFHLWKHYREITLVYRCEPRNVDPSFYDTYGYRRKDDWKGTVLAEPMAFGDGYIYIGEIEVPIGDSKVLYHLQTYQLNATGAVQTLSEDTYLIGYGGPQYGNRVQRELYIYRHFKCDQEIIVYGVSRFNRSESQRSVIDQYTALLHLIISQNPNVDEFWKQFNHFERSTINDKKTNVLKLFKEGMESTIFPNFTKNPVVGNQLLILKLLSKFERRVKGEQKPNTLSTIAIKRCGKFLLSLGDSEALAKSDIRSDVKRMVRSLIDEHKEDSPHSLILYFKLKKHYEMLKKEMKELDDHGSDDDDEYDFFDDEMDDFPGFHNFDRRGGRELMHMMGPGPRRRQHIGRLINFHMNEVYLNEVIPYFGEFPELQELCIDKANPPGLAYLAKKGVVKNTKKTLHTS